jgi:hypothetical protein
MFFAAGLGFTTRDVVFRFMLAEKPAFPQSQNSKLEKNSTYQLISHAVLSIDKELK